MKKGYIQIYTGCGKGKTTAALGLALRAAGAGLKTYILQFMKDFPYSESISLKKLSDTIKIKKIGKDDFVFKKEMPSKAEVQIAEKSLKEAEELMLSGKYDLIILDEVCVAIYFKVLEEKLLLEFIEKKPENIELIITGRYCSEKIIEKADLVTEMKEIKHYYKKGVLSRKGIDS